MTGSQLEKGIVVEVEGYATPTKEGVEHKEEDQDSTEPPRHAFKGDDSDGKITWTFRTVLAAISLSGLYTASQILLYFTGGILDFIIQDIGDARAIGWIPTSYLVALSATAPFVGYLQDLLGRRLIGIFGCTLLCIGCVLMATTHSFAQTVVAMVLSGAGAAISELTAIAGIADVVPVRLRGLSVAGITSFMIPFLPFVLYGQLIATHSTWRWTSWLCFIYTVFVLVGITFTYFPKTHPRAEGFSRRSILAKLDYVGGLLSITGLTLFLVALSSAGYTHPWRSAYVLCQLLIGLALLIAFVIWEWKGAKVAMVPAALFQGQRIVALAYIIVFVAGMNFYSFLNLFPTTLSSLYSPGPVQTGTRSFGFAFGIGIGVTLGDAALSWVKGQVRIVFIVSAVLMTVFLGAFAVANPDNSTLTTTFGSLAGFGCGGILTPSAVVAMIVVPDAYLATAAALSLSVRGVGGAIGYTIYSNILNAKLASKLPASVATYAMDAGLPPPSVEQFVETFLSTVGNLSTIPEVTPAIIQAAILGERWAYADSFRYVWLTTIVFGVISIGCSMFVPSIKRWETSRVAAQM